MHANAVTRVVAALSNEQVRALLTEMLTDVPETPGPKRIKSAADRTAPAVRARKAKGKRVIDEEKRKHYAANRKAKRDAAKTARPLRSGQINGSAKKATAPAPAKKAKRRFPAGGRPPKTAAPVRPGDPASNGADEAWKSTAHAVHSVAARLGPTAVR